MTRKIALLVLAFALVASAGVAEAKKNDHLKPPVAVPPPTAGDVAPPPLPPASAPPVEIAPPVVIETALAIAPIPAPIEYPSASSLPLSSFPSAAPPAPAADTPAPTASPVRAAPASRPMIYVDDPIIFVAAPAPVPPSVGERADRLFAPGSSPALAVTSVSAPLPGLGAWRGLAWALPLLAVGGAGTVLLFRRKPRAATMAEPESKASIQMAPVSPTDVAGLLRNGQAATTRGAIDEAVAWFERALCVEPRLAVAHFCKGVCLAEAGRAPDAFLALEAAVKHAPEEASYRVHLARAALALGKTRDAMDALAHVAAAMPELGPALLEDPRLAGLRDHPQFLVMCGAL